MELSRDYKKILISVLKVEAGIGVIFACYMCLVWWAISSNMYDPTYDFKSLVSASPYILATIAIFGGLPIALIAMIQKEKKPAGEILLLAWSIILSIPIFLIPISLTHGWLYWRWKMIQTKSTKSEQDAAGNVQRH